MKTRRSRAYLQIARRNAQYASLIQRYHLLLDTNAFVKFAEQVRENLHKLLL